MGRVGTRPLALLMAGFLLSGWSNGQQPALQTKNMPAMNSDDSLEGGYVARGAAVSVDAHPGESTPKGWVRYFPANCGLSIALPRRPLEADLPVSPQDKALFRSSSNSFYTDGSLTVIAAHFQTVTPTPASSIVDSFFESLSESEGVRDLRYSANPTGRPTRTDVVATYHSSNWVELEGFIEVIGTHGWLVVSMHQQGNIQSKEKGRRVLESALFDGASCVD